VKRARAGSRTVSPPEVPTTTCSVSPEIAGDTDASRLVAVLESVPGSDQESVKRLPAAREIPVIVSSASSHAASTTGRCRTHQEAVARMSPPECRVTQYET
jgi:alpha-ketoglutarate-dependent taurine dioxygenase